MYRDVNTSFVGTEKFWTVSDSETVMYVRTEKLWTVSDSETVRYVRTEKLWTLSHREIVAHRDLVVSGPTP